MGRRGPKPLPAAMLRLRGSPLARSRGGAEVAAPAGIPDAPAWLDGEARTIYGGLRDELALVPGRVGSIDGLALAMLADAIADYRAARELVRSEGPIATNDKGVSYLHPAAAAKAEAWKRVRRGFADFGLSPAERVGLGLIGEPGEGPDPLEAAMRD